MDSTQEQQLPTDRQWRARSGEICRARAAGEEGEARSLSAQISPTRARKSSPRSGSWKKFKGNGYVEHRGSPGDGRGRGPGHCARQCPVESLGAPGSARRPHTEQLPLERGGGVRPGSQHSPRARSPHRVGREGSVGSGCRGWAAGSDLGPLLHVAL